MHGGEIRPRGLRSPRARTGAVRARSSRGRPARQGGAGADGRAVALRHARARAVLDGIAFRTNLRRPGARGA
ncbi:hypothetical protein GCM10010371_41380 [Streptomyces subrutilus]|uniref:Uncharacterized protein n=1 Tax=Streptomyces subrutilus TaxID=36818 RepID=A0A5P2UQM6_9ACTN|nr:hypothetical protein CP968_12440 [Streptomyces subrutilus]GGZ77320.1 hypothetical protein GCM10010371_41380 [Streptomyces subrutilus]